MTAYHTAINIAVVVNYNYEFIMCTLFFGCVFMLRHIHDDFNINDELRKMSLTLYICDALYLTSLIFLYDTAFVVLGFAQYFQVILCVCLLLLTAKSIRKSYEPNSIIPFPLTHESIQ